MKEAVKNEEGKVRDVLPLIGITDYDALFEGVVDKNLSGIKELKVLRCSADENGHVCAYYKPAQIMNGWFPKPVEDTLPFSYYQDLFRSLNPLDGVVLKVDTIGNPGLERGQRQHWIHTVQYASGVQREIPVKCISLPIKFDDEKANFIEKLQYEAHHQPFNGKFRDASYRLKVQNNIRQLLECRKDMESYPSWESFFDKFYGIVDFSSTLFEVFKRCGGDIVPSVYNPVRNERAGANEIVQPLIWPAIPISSSKQRQRVLEERIQNEHRAYLLERINKKNHELVYYPIMFPNQDVPSPAERIVEDKDKTCKKTTKRWYVLNTG
jgi:hypothetical protein